MAPPIGKIKNQGALHRKVDRQSIKDKYIYDRAYSSADSNLVFGGGFFAAWLAVLTFLCALATFHLPVERDTKHATALWMGNENDG
jgi:hypothetical protein